MARSTAARAARRAGRCRARLGARLALVPVAAAAHLVDVFRAVPISHVRAASASRGGRRGGCRGRRVRVAGIASATGEVAHVNATIRAGAVGGRHYAAAGAGVVAAGPRRRRRGAGCRRAGAGRSAGRCRRRRAVGTGARSTCELAFVSARRGGRATMATIGATALIAGARTVKDPHAAVPVIATGIGASRRRAGCRCRRGCRG